uniref:RRM domain-containing protein n=1 Tax=Kalanchoe fedtschenkoi TaxID=63787 RepID=A0A7N0V4S1_KALFE
MSGVDFGSPRAQAKSSDYVVKHTHDNAMADSELHGHPDGKRTGDVLISQDDAKKAMSKAETMIGSYGIEIPPSTLKDLPATNTEWRRERDCRDRVKESSNNELTEPVAYSRGKPKRSSGKERKEYTQTLKLRNVPPSADMYDIIELFGEFNLTLDRLQIVCRRDGIATGEVYVEFDSVEDAKNAMSKDKKKILSEYVQLFPSSPNEASRAMARFG